ncbi:hypothetical protein H4R35_001551 [Dimargaris xerosporica]|nr:hypothetical protein H4R35_001551 [Dimargaris xerosporica]
MGVRGLLPFLRKRAGTCMATQSLADFRNQTLAVDCHILLHKFVQTTGPLYSPAVTLAPEEEETTIAKRHLWGFLLFARTLQSYNITPIFVFDGTTRPAEKRVAHEKRHERSTELKKTIAEEEAHQKRIQAVQKLTKKIEMLPTKQKVELYDRYQQVYASVEATNALERHAANAPIKRVAFYLASARAKIRNERRQLIQEHPMLKERLRLLNTEYSSILLLIRQLWKTTVDYTAKGRALPWSAPLPGSPSSAQAKPHPQPNASPPAEHPLPPAKSHQSREPEPAPPLAQIEIPPDGLYPYFSPEPPVEPPKAPPTMPLPRAEIRKVLPLPPSPPIAASTPTTITSLEADILPIAENDGLNLDAKNEPLAPQAYQARLDQLHDEHSARMSRLEARATKITAQMVTDTIRLLKQLGFDTLRAQGFESEAVCASLYHSEITAGTISEDSDLILLSDGPLLTKYSLQSTRVIVVDPAKARRELGFTRNQFIDFSILCGTDFCSTLPKIGPVTAFQLVHQHVTIENILTVVKASPDKDFQFQAARDIFQHLPEVPKRISKRHKKSCLGAPQKESEKVTKLAEQLPVPYVPKRDIQAIVNQLTHVGSTGRQDFVAQLD